MGWDPNDPLSVGNAAVEETASNAASAASSAASNVVQRGTAKLDQASQAAGKATQGIQSATQGVQNAAQTISRTTASIVEQEVTAFIPSDQLQSAAGAASSALSQASKYPDGIVVKVKTVFGQACQDLINPPENAALSSFVSQTKAGVQQLAAQCTQFESYAQSIVGIGGKIPNMAQLQSAMGQLNKLQSMVKDPTGACMDMAKSAASNMASGLASQCVPVVNSVAHPVLNEVGFYQRTVYAGVNKAKTLTIDGQTVLVDHPTTAFEKVTDFAGKAMDFVGDAVKNAIPFMIPGVVGGAVGTLISGGKLKDALPGMAAGAAAGVAASMMMPLVGKITGGDEQSSGDGSSSRSTGLFSTEQASTDDTFDYAESIAQRKQALNDAEQARAEALEPYEPGLVLPQMIGKGAAINRYNDATNRLRGSNDDD